MLQWSTTETVAFTSATSWHIRIATGAAVPDGWSDLWTLLEPNPPREDARSDAETSSAHPQVFLQLADWLSGQILSGPAPTHAERLGRR